MGRLEDLDGAVRERRWLVGGAIIAVLAAAPFVLTDFLLELLFTGLIFVMLGVSWNLLAGYAGQISLGHAAFFGTGAFVSAWATTPTTAGLPEAVAMPAVVGILVGGAGAGLLALVTGPAMFRLHGHYFAVGTLALAAIIQLLMINSREISGGSTGYYVAGGNELLRYYYAVAFTVIVVLATYRLVNSRTGLGMRAVKGDEAAANSLGVHPLRYKMYAFVASSAFAGLAGGVFAQFTFYINPETTLGVVWTIDALVVVVLGGMGTMLGPLLGAAIFLVLDNALGEFVGDLATTVEGLILILFVIYLPHGLYGRLRARRGEEPEG